MRRRCDELARKICAGMACGFCDRVSLVVLVKRSPIPACTAPLKRTPIKRSTKPVNKKRKAPRRGRVVDRNRLAWAAQKPCQVTGEFPATTHHVRECGSPKDDTKIIRLVEYLHMKTAARSGIPCVEDGKEVFEKFHGVKISILLSQLAQDYDYEESGLGVGWGT